MKENSFAQGTSIAVHIVILALLAWQWGTRGLSRWTFVEIPIVLVLFFFSYLFDVKIRQVKGEGHYNMDHLVAFPAAVLLGSPVLAGVLGSLGLLGSRFFREGKKSFRLRNFFSVTLVAVSLGFGTWIFLLLMKPETSQGLGHSHPVAAFSYLLAAMIAGMLVNWICFILGAPLRLSSFKSFKDFAAPFIGNFQWILLSSPFAALVVDLAIDKRYFYLMLGTCTLLVAMWALHLSAGLEDRTEALANATGRQEFLQQLSTSALSSLSDDSYVTNVLAGFREYVSWKRGCLVLLSQGDRLDPLLATLGEPFENEKEIIERLSEMMDGVISIKATIRNSPGLEPLLMENARSQIIAPIATTELVFGIMVLERGPGEKSFSAAEARFLETVAGELARPIQEDILKRQLLRSNEKLSRQADHLSQILHISNMLKVHMDIQTILDRVAKGIKEGLGFDSVLISIYNEDEGCFERIAQAGIDEIWEEVKAKKPPASEIFSELQEKNRIEGCYFVSHNETERSEYDVLPVNPLEAQAKAEGDWDPMDALFVPLEGKDKRLLGIISVDEPVDGKIPNAETLRALEVLANQTVNALEGARIHAQTRRKAVMDALTGLYNHGYFQETLATMAKEHAEANQPYTILMMDLDDFKQVNDVHGHMAGDEVLKKVAEALNSCIRRGDIAARYGGEEFVLLLPRCEIETADEIAERIRAAVASISLPVEGDEEARNVTISIGIASCPKHGKDHKLILEKADHALYVAKRHGKNRVSATR